MFGVRETIGYSVWVKRFADFLVNSMAASVFLVVLAVAFVLFLIPPLHPLAWLFGLIVTLVGAVCMVLTARQWSHDQERIDQLNADLAAAWGQVRPIELTDPEAEARRPDAKSAERIAELFPQDIGLVAELRVASTPTTLNNDSFEALTAFLAEFKRGSFHDRDSHFAFMELFRSAERLAGWVSAETREVPDAPARQIVSGDSRRGGWREFGQAQSAGEEATAQFIEARAEFQRAALVAGVLH